MLLVQRYDLGTTLVFILQKSSRKANSSGNTLEIQIIFVLFNKSSLRGGMVKNI